MTEVVRYNREFYVPTREDLNWASALIKALPEGARGLIPAPHAIYQISHRDKTFTRVFRGAETPEDHHRHRCVWGLLGYTVTDTSNRVHRGSDVRSCYEIPRTAVAGVSDTGNWPDSPCRPEDVLPELGRLCDHLELLGFTLYGVVMGTGNPCCNKRWLCVADAGELADAAAEVKKWLAAHDDLQYIHGADLDQLLEELS